MNWRVAQMCRRWGAWFLLVVATLANSGCLLVATGVAGGAAVGYAYCKGKLCAMYSASFDDVWAATHTALNELAMPIVKEENQGHKGFIDSRTADGEHVRIYLKTESSRIPAEADATRVCIRVGTFGDHPVSLRIMDQIGLHLMPASALNQPPPPAQATLGPMPIGFQPASPPQTAPPPLLPPAPVAVGDKASGGR